MPQVTPGPDVEVAWMGGNDLPGGASYYSANGYGYQTRKWGATSIDPTAGGNVSYYFDPASNWTAIEKAAFVNAFAQYAMVANITFTEATSAPTSGITITRSSDGTSHTDVTATNVSGRATINSAVIAIDTSAPGLGPIGGGFANYGGAPWTDVLHQVGHALGLADGGRYDDANEYNGQPVDPRQQQVSEYDSQFYTVMSRVDPADKTALYASRYPNRSFDWGTVTNNGGTWDRQPTSLMSMDIRVLQGLYGASTATPPVGGVHFGFNTNSTIAAYNFDLNPNPVVTLYSTAPHNTLDLSGFSAPSTINMASGYYSTSGLAYNMFVADGTVIDTVILGSGNDTITANNSGVTITGYLGDDTITGGAGNDTAVYSAARSSYLVSRFNPTFRTTVSGADGNDSLSNIENLAFSDGTVTVASLKAPGDFNGDGYADILWQNTQTGQPSIYLEYGTSQYAGSGPLSDTNGADWRIVGTGYQRFTGQNVIFWQRNDGQAAMWTMNGTQIYPDSYEYGLIGGNPGVDWKVVGGGDFNGDTSLDMLWQNSTTGELSIYFSVNPSANQGAGSGRLSVAPGASVRAVGSGDFDGDGKSDILFQDSATGQASIWFMNGTNRTSSANIGGPVSDWKVIGGGDFNKDGKSDILWQNTSTGQLSIFFMDGSTVLPGSGVFTGNAPAGWVAKGAEDLNGDGYSDILWQNVNTGQASAYLMSGTTILPGSGPFGGAPGSSWQIIANTG